MVQTYNAPLRDMRFVLNELLDVGEIATLPGYEDATPDVIDAMIEEGAKLCENTLLPLNRPADEEGCHYENGVVRTPARLQGGLQDFRRCRLDRRDHVARLRRQGAAAAHQHGLRRDGVLDESGLRRLPAALQRRRLGDRAARHGSAEAGLSATPGRRHLERHHVPDRAPLRHGPRPDPHQGRADGRGPLRALRHQDLHLGRRARPDREHSPPRAGEAARRAGGCARHQPLPGAEAHAEG